MSARAGPDPDDATAGDLTTGDLAAVGGDMGGAGAGAIVGGLIGKGTGAVIGGVVGGAVGAQRMTQTKDNDIFVAPGTPMRFAVYRRRGLSVFA